VVVEAAAEVAERSEVWEQQLELQMLDEHKIPGLGFGWVFYWVF